MCFLPFQDISLLIPDFYEILDIEDESMPHAPVDADLDPDISGKVSSHSKDSGRNSSRASSRGRVYSISIILAN